MKRYEGLFILNITGKEDALNSIIESISKEIAALGGKVESIQKMDKHQFARARNKKVTSGYYVNFVFECSPSVINQLRNKFVHNEYIFRTMFTVAPPKPAVQQQKPVEANA